MEDREIVAWVTVNGTHIPIFAGEKKSDAIRRHIQELADKQAKEKEAQIKKNSDTAKSLSEAKAKEDEDKHKSAQLEIIKKSNAMTDDYHTGIRKVSDIQTFKEAYENREKDDSGVYPDVKESDYREALKSGYITVYSSKTIKNGTFVSPSKMMAQDYAGGGKVQSMQVSINDVAWINLDEGVFAKVR